MICKDCIHFDVCDALEANGISKISPSQCGCYKPKSRFVELPCEVGQMVYSLADCITQVFVGKVYEISIREHGIVFRFSRQGFYSGAGTTNDIGKTVFLTKEEAEKALAERNKK